MCPESHFFTFAQHFFPPLSVLPILFGVVAMTGVCESVHVLILHAAISVQGKAVTSNVCKRSPLARRFLFCIILRFSASRWGTRGG